MKAHGNVAEGFMSPLSPSGVFMGESGIEFDKPTEQERLYFEGLEPEEQKDT